MVVVDTNILAYLLIAGDRTREAPALHGRDSDWKSEAFLLVEFSNILATYQRRGELDPNQVEGLMNDAETRISGPIHVSHIIALRTAQKYRISAYDARFIATAEKLDAKLVTEDTKLRKAAPRLTLSLADALS
jgi:predicted nucleic acid-binding protein